jgi:hypothetical protein
LAGLQEEVGYKRWWHMKAGGGDAPQCVGSGRSGGCPSSLLSSHLEDKLCLPRGVRQRGDGALAHGGQHARHVHRRGLVGGEAGWGGVGWGERCAWAVRGARCA